MNKIAFTLTFFHLTAMNKLKARRDAGQGTLEYVGMIAVAAIIVVALITVAQTADFGVILTDALAKVKSKIPA